MTKASRLLEALWWIPDHQLFTARDLARALDVSPRTASRYLEELLAMGVPLTSRPGPHGGYQLIRPQRLPPVSFTVDEALAIFFVAESLHDYQSLPFRADLDVALEKLRQKLSPVHREEIQLRRDRLRFVVPDTHAAAPHVQAVLEASVHGQVIRVVYQSARGPETRTLQPVGVYAEAGHWYCPAYCFTRESLRVFRVDRMLSVEIVDDPSPRADVGTLTIRTYDGASRAPHDFTMSVDLTGEAYRRLSHAPGVSASGDETGRWTIAIERRDIPFFARMISGLAPNARALAPAELVREVRRLAMALIEAHIDEPQR